MSYPHIFHTYLYSFPQVTHILVSVIHSFSTSIIFYLGELSTYSNYPIDFEYFTYQIISTTSVDNFEIGKH